MLLAIMMQLMTPKFFLHLYCCFLLNVSFLMYIFTLEMRNGKREGKSNYVHSCVFLHVQAGRILDLTCFLLFYDVHFKWITRGHFASHLVFATKRNKYRVSFHCFNLFKFSLITTLKAN